MRDWPKLFIRLPMRRVTLFSLQITGNIFRLESCFTAVSCHFRSRISNTCC